MFHSKFQCKSRIATASLDKKKTHQRDRFVFMNRFVAIDAYRVCVLFPVKKESEFITWTKWVRHFFVAVRKLWELFSADETTKSVPMNFSTILSLASYLCAFRCITKELSVNNTSMNDFFPNGTHTRENCVLSAEKNCCAFKRINPGALLSICVYIFFHFKNENRLKLKRNSTILNLLKPCSLFTPLTAKKRGKR